MPRVVIADDHPVYRAGLRGVIDGSGRYTVVGEASDGVEAIEQLRAHAPDVAVIDLSMPRLDGFEVLQQAATWADPPPLVVLTMHDAYASRALELGAMGYLLKEDAPQEILACLDDVLRARRHVSPSLAGARPDELAPPALDTLSDAERRVLRLVAQHKTSREIAGVLHVSPRTVQNHRANMVKKLGLSGSHALLRFAIEHLPE